MDRDITENAYRTIGAETMRRGDNKHMNGKLFEMWKDMYLPCKNSPRALTSSNSVKGLADEPRQSMGA